MASAISKFIQIYIRAMWIRKLLQKVHAGPKNDIKKSHTSTVLDMHEFLNLYEKEWPKFKKESKTVPTPRTLELLVFDG